MLNNSTHQKKLNLLQVCRGLAALLVLLAHGNTIFQRELHQNFLFKLFGFGGSGVDFFFVLSGFIIFYIHQADIGQPTRLKSFVIKRFLRIYPLYWLVFTAKMAASFFFSYDTGDIHQRNLCEVFKAILLYPQDRNLLNHSFIGVSWTLSHEILFYIVFSLLIVLKPKISVPLVTAWFIGIFLNFLGVIEVFKESFLLQFIFNALNLEFFMGCLAAYFVSKHKISYGMILTSVAVFIFTLSAITHNVLEVSRVIYYGVPFMLLVIGAVSLEMSGSIKVPYIFTYIGDSSYSIYLMHGFFISNIVKILVKLHSVSLFQNPILLNGFAIIIVITTLGLGCAFYSYIEKPLLSTLKLKLATRS